LRDAKLAVPWLLPEFGVPRQNAKFDPAKEVPPALMQFRKSPQLSPEGKAIAKEGSSLWHSQSFVGLK
jgi:hypothetical protein